MKNSNADESLLSVNTFSLDSDFLNNAQHFSLQFQLSRFFVCSTVKQQTKVITDFANDL